MSKTRRWLVLAAVSAGLLMVTADTTVLYTALPALTGDLQAGASQKLWIINAYPLVMAGLLPGAGTLGDRIGHKPMCTAGLALFAAASLLAAFAPSPPVLIAARAFLAVGAAAMLPATAALIRITFDEHERGIAIGVWGTMAVLGAALGPVAGGLLLQRFWWGSVFLLNIPVVLLALAAAAALVPGGSGHRDRPWDLTASLQAMAALAGLVYAVQEAAKPGPAPLAIAGALLAAAAGSVTFARRQRRAAYPLIDLSLSGNRSLLTGVIAAALAMAATAGTGLLLTQRLQLALGLTPLHAGLIVTAFAAGSLPVGVLAGGLLHRTGARPLTGGGLLLGALGVLAALQLTPGAGPCPAAAAARHGSCRAWSWPARAWASSWSPPPPRSSAAPRRSTPEWPPPSSRSPANSAASPASPSWEPSSPPSTPARSTSPQPPPPGPPAASTKPAPPHATSPPAKPAPCSTPPPAPSTTATPSPWPSRPRPGRRQRLHLPPPHPAAHHPHRTGPARHGGDRRGRRQDRVVQLYLVR